MDGGNKLLAVLDGKPVVARTIRAAMKSAVGNTIVVTGHEPEAVAEAAETLGATSVHHAKFEAGMASTIAAGVRASSKADGYLILPGDMPLVQTETLQAVASRFARGRIVVPTFQGHRGHPVLFASDFHQDLLALTGDHGARPVIEQHAAAVIEVEVDDPGILSDVDTPEDLHRLESIWRGDRPPIR